MSENNLRFPDFFPEGCPPVDAKAEEISVYRYCVNDNVGPEDFKSYYENGKDDKHINAYGISVISDKTECYERFKMPAIRKKYRCIANGITYKNTGVIKKTPTQSIRSHYTWWLYVGAQPATNFIKCK